MTKELIAVVDGREIGLVRQGRDGKLSFTYADGWRNSAEAFPLSLSMPLALTEHAHAKIDPFLWGLLPDSERILDQWGRRFHVSSRNAFALVSHVGEDCAGAVQFVTPSRVSAIRRQSPADEMARRSRHCSKAAFLARRPRSVAAAPRYRTIQFGGRAAKNRFAIP